MTYIRAQANGNYSSTATWVGGVVPTTGDVACCGSYRVTVDVNPLADLSATNVDWVAAGGTTLSQSHSGGFNINSGITTQKLRYSFFRTSNDAAHSDYLVTNGTVITGDAIYVVDTVIASGSHQSFWFTPNSTASLTIGDIYCSATTQTTKYFLTLTTTSSSAVTLSIGKVQPISGTTLGSGGVYAYGLTAYASVAFTVRNDPMAGTHTAIYFANANTVGESSLTFSEQIKLLGASATTTGIDASNFKTVSIPSIDLSSSTITNSIAVSLTSCSSSLTCGEITTGGINGVDFGTCTGNATISGDVKRISPATGNAAAITGTFTNLNITGKFIDDGTLRTSTSTASSGRIANIAGVVVCTGIKGIGKAQSTIYIQSTTATTFTVNGNIDLSLVSAHTNSSVSAIYVDSSTNNLNVVINGDVIPPAAVDSTTSTSYYCIYLTPSSSGSINLTVNGTIYGGKYIPSLATNSSSTLAMGLQATSVIGGDANNGVTIPTVILNTQAITVDNLATGNTGRWPVNGRVLFRTASSPTFTGYKVSGAQVVMSTGLPSGTMPAASDVRYGVAVNNTTGTCHIPAAEYVSAGVAIDNTVGTLTGGLTTNQAQQLQDTKNAVDAITPKVNIIMANVL